VATSSSGNAVSLLEPNAEVSLDPYYILATSAPSDQRPRVLKQDDTFGIFDSQGDIQSTVIPQQGLFHQGTRFLSRLVLKIYGHRPLLLSSSIVENNGLLAVDLTNPDLYVDGKLLIPRGMLHLFRSTFLWQGICYDRVRIANYGTEPVELKLGFEFDSDFVDIFEVRGSKRARRGTHREPIFLDGVAQLSYRGLDEVERTTRVAFAPPPTRAFRGEARFSLRLEPKQEESCFLTVTCEVQRPIRAARYSEAYAESLRSLARMERRECQVQTANPQFNEWVARSTADLRMMITETPAGPFPYAGVPWFSAPFGRDAIITALETLWLNPDIARGVLRFLAQTQATENIPEEDAEPGKILHELRMGEMAALKEIPFGRYYGSVDATPLFVILAGEFYRAAGDRPLIGEIWPNVERALAWMDGAGDLDQDGFVEYARRSERGLVHQGWKDSWEAVFHRDGRLAEPPIALCEVQGYVYAAKREASLLARVLGRHDRANELAQQARRLRQHFERAFWIPELSTYALALDGQKQPCRVRSSNAGHCLFSDIASPERAKRLAHLLLSDEFFSGWGIRTLAASEARYNPMSYHNGSVWPHDNALIAEGLSRYGFKQLALQLLTSLYETSLWMDLHRMPELFCGFVRRPGEGPTMYPVACSPQSWAAGSVLMLLGACLGLSVDAPRSRVRFFHPKLPAFLPEIQLKNLRVNQGSVDLTLYRYAEGVSINVESKEGPLEVVVVK
jgi:glycogen debranching enzyme